MILVVGGQEGHQQLLEHAKSVARINPLFAAGG